VWCSPRAIDVTGARCYCCGWCEVGERVDDSHAWQVFVVAIVVGGCGWWRP
jgi:hypothetical protein